MVIPNFIFLNHNNSFSVKISNLEVLSVEQIQEIQKFVSVRKGIFDFSSHSFVIQKRIGFEEFQNLLKYSDLKATTIQKFHYEEQKARVTFGKYKGLHYSELPDSYMLWLKTNYNGKEKDKIVEELNRRGL